MGLHDKTKELIRAAKAVLSEYNPMTLRQVFYQLVSSHAQENTPEEYDRLGRALVNARKEGMIPWEWLEDRTRRPHDVSMWRDLPAFIETVKTAYRRDVWISQAQQVVVWLEKDALSGVFEEITEDYGVSLVVGRGYNSWSVRKTLADRIAEYEDTGKPTTILYFGDFDPSGEDILRDLEESFGFFEVFPELVKVALTPGQVEEYHLPPNFAKHSDSRAKKFIEKHGEKAAVELDALPVKVLQAMIRENVESCLDLSALESVRQVQAEERARLVAMFE